MSGGSKKQTTGPSAYAKGFVTPAAQSVRNAYNANSGAVQNIANTIQKGIPGLAEKAFGTNPLLQKAQGYATDVIGGKYLEGNPHLQAMIDQTANDVTDRVEASIGARGRTGGNAHSEILGRELAEAESGLRFANYGKERDAMAQAAALTPGLIDAEFAGIAPLLGAAGAGAEIPFAASNNYARNIAGLMGNYNTTEQKQSMGLGDWLGLGLSAASVFSDRRLKTDIRKIGEYADGLGRYLFRYIWGGPVREGVMADEVARLRPWALGPTVEGFATVNMEAL